MKTKKISVITTIVVTILIASFSFAQPPAKPFPPQKPGMQMMQNRKVMLEKLNLTDKQKEEFGKLKTEFQKKMIDLKANLQKSLIDLKEIRGNDDINRSDVINAVKKINSNKNAIALASANHRMDMYEILTPAQRKIWKTFKMHQMVGKRMMKNKFKKNMKKRFRR